MLTDVRPGKDFNDLVFAVKTSFMRYNQLNCLDEMENHATPGELFEHPADDYAVITYSQRLQDFFRCLFLISFKTIFDLFETVWSAKIKRSGFLPTPESTILRRMQKIVALNFCTPELSIY
ncbi:hypothetical protein QUF90_22755 [Desulfococcaceae bacterium HSG9]|nr:hypothetical protein [Desulfococcaceae bacterium HSG9]